jgi:tetratricopeptide (TPR) repeat protein
MHCCHAENPQKIRNYLGMNRKISKIILALFLLIYPMVSLYAGYYNRGRTQFVYKNYDKAKEMFLKAVESHDHGDSYYFLGEIEKLQKNYKQAMEYYQKAATLRTTKKYKKNAFWNLIVLAEMSGDYDNLVKTSLYMWEKLRDSGARKKIEGIINKSLWTDNLEAIAKYKAGIKLKKRKKFDEAEVKFREAVSIEPAFLAPKFELGMYAYKRGETSTALQYLEDISDRIPFYAEVHMIMADIHFNNRNYEKAARHFDRAIEYGFIRGKTRYLLRLKRGTSYYNTGNLEKAREDIDYAVNYNKKSLEPLLLLSAINIKLNDYDAALKALIKASKIDNNNPVIIYKIGSIYYKKDDWKSVSYFDRLFDMTVKGKKKTNSRYIRAFEILAKKHFAKKNYSRVLEITGSLENELNDYRILLLKAKSYFHTAQYDNAVDIFEKLSLDNEQRFILCKSYYLSKRKKKAEELLKSLISNDEYYKKAKKHSFLSKLVEKIEKEKLEKEQREKAELEKNSQENADTREESTGETGQ